MLEMHYPFAAYIVTASEESLNQAVRQLTTKCIYPLRSYRNLALLYDFRTAQVGAYCLLDHDVTSLMK